MKNSSFWQLLTNPFTRIAGWKAFLIGIATMLATTVACYFSGACLSGVLHVQLAVNVGIEYILLSQLSVLLVLVVVIYVVAKFATKHVRFQDVLGISTLAQAPILLLVLPMPLIASFLEMVKPALSGEPIYI